MKKKRVMLAACTGGKFSSHFGEGKGSRERKDCFGLRLFYVSFKSVQEVAENGISKDLLV